MACESADRMVSGYERFGRFSGIVAVFGRSGQQWIRPVEYARREDDLVADASTPFGIASCTKMFTSAAILALVEERVISLGDPLSRFLPGFGESARALGAIGAVTIGDLLSHRSGIDKDIGRFFGEGRIVLPAEKAIRFDDLVRTLSPIALRRKPGESFDYNNLNYALLSRVIETLTGRTYGEYLKTRFFDPLSMTSSWYGDSLEPKECAIPYAGPHSEWKRAPAWHDSWAPGATGVRTSASDAGIWLRELLAGRLYGKKTLRSMLARRGWSGPAEVGYGIFVMRAGKAKYAFHDGCQPGWAASMGSFLDGSAAIVVLSNRTKELDSISMSAATVNELHFSIVRSFAGIKAVPLPVPVKASATWPSRSFESDGVVLMTSPAGEGAIDLSTSEGSPFECLYLRRIARNTPVFLRAERAIEALGRGNVAEALSCGSFLMKLFVKPSDLAAIWKEIAGDTGAFLSASCYKAPELDGEYRFRVRFEKKDVGIKVYMRGGKVSGMTMDRSFATGGPATTRCVAVEGQAWFMDGYPFDRADALIRFEGPFLTCESGGLSARFTEVS